MNVISVDDLIIQIVCSEYRVSHGVGGGGDRKHPYRRLFGARKALYRQVIFSVRVCVCLCVCVFLRIFVCVYSEYDSILSSMAT